MSATLDAAGGGPEASILDVEHLYVRAGAKVILSDVTVAIPRGRVVAVIGPSGCGKTTFLRTLNRMTELSPGLRVTGTIRYQGRNIYDPKVNPVLVRRRIGMVFQRPAVFPTSIYENVAFALRLEGADEDEVERTVQTSLRRAGLWDEVRDNLDRAALSLSGGQQQRLCIARALAAHARVLLMDEPTSSLDPMATQKIESMLRDLQGDLTVVIVTHNIAQAARASDYTAYFYQGKLIEVGRTAELFEAPKQALTEEYITGRFG